MVAVMKKIAAKAALAATKKVVKATKKQTTTPKKQAKQAKKIVAAKNDATKQLKALVKQAKLALQQTEQERTAALKDLQKALQDGYGMETPAIVKAVVVPALSKAADERIEFEETGVEMIESYLSKVAAFLDEECANATNLVDEIDSMEAKFLSEKEALETEKSNSEELRGVLENRVADNTTKLANAEQALKAAKQAKKTLVEQGQKLEQELSLVQTTLATEYKTLVEGTAPTKPAAAKMLKTVMDVAKTVLKVESSMLVSLPTVLGSAPAERATFSTLVLAEVEKHAAAWIAATSEKLGAHPAQLAACEQVLQTAEQTRTECDAALVESKSELAEAKAEIEELTKKLQENRKLLKQHPKDLADAQAGLEEAEATEDAWHTVCGQFELLKTYTTPSPVDEAALAAALTAGANVVSFEEEWDSEYSPEHSTADAPEDVAMVADVAQVEESAPVEYTMEEEDVDMEEVAASGMDMQTESSDFQE